MRELLAWPAGLLHPLPDSVTDTDGALLEPLGVAIHALDLGHVRLGARVAVVGCGPIGLLLIAVLRTAGARHIAAFEPLPHRREAALRYGADVCLRPDILPGDLRELVGEGADTVFEMAGTADAVTLSMAAARPGGRVVLGGIPSDDRIAFEASTARRKGLTIAMVRRMNNTYGRAIALAAAGSFSLAPLVTDRFGLASAGPAFGIAAKRKGLKVIIEPAA
jgi:L-iditol 2-dehydrogenase